MRPTSHDGLVGGSATLLILLCALVPTITFGAPPTPTTAPATQTVQSPPPADAIQERLVGIRAATLAAFDFADAHGDALPTTAQLAEKMGVPLDQFHYVVLINGLQKDHLKRVGGWPEVLMAEKKPGASDLWAFGFMDGLCLIDSVAGYKKNEVTPALAVISASGKRPSTRP